MASASSMSLMELSHSLTLNEAVVAQLPEAQRPIFVYEWLCFLDRVLAAAQKSDVKGCQKQLVEQLMAQVTSGNCGPPTRRLLARCLVTLFSVGDALLLFETANRCADLVKQKDDAPSYLLTRLAAISCLGALYERLGRMLGRSYEEAVATLVRTLRSAESQGRAEIMSALEKICRGMGSAASNVHREISKAARLCLVDRAMAVRSAAAKCLLELAYHAPFLYTVELESLATLCSRAFDSASYDARCSVARFLGTLVALTQQQPVQKLYQVPNTNVGKWSSLDDALGTLANAFVRAGGSSSAVNFLKGGDNTSGSSAGAAVGAVGSGGGAGISTRQIRVGIAHAYVVTIETLGGEWLEQKLPIVIRHVLELASPKSSSTSSSASHVETVYARRCVLFILRRCLGRMLGEGAQQQACSELINIINKGLITITEAENAKEVTSATAECSPHALTCALLEMGSLLLQLGTTATSTLLQGDMKSESSGTNILDMCFSALLHSHAPVRLAAAWCIRCACVACPSRLTPCVDRCIARLEGRSSTPESVSGYSAALAALLGATHETPMGIPHARGKMAFNVAEELLRSANQNSRLSLQRTNAGWLIIGAIATLGPQVVRGLLPRMLLLWRNAFPRSPKELASERARGDAFTWQVALEGRAGALASAAAFLACCKDTAISEDAVRRLVAPMESAIAMLVDIGSVVKSYGPASKASCALVRLRLYECLGLLLPLTNSQSQQVMGSSTLTHLLRLLVSELTLSESAANAATSLLAAGGESRGHWNIEGNLDGASASAGRVLLGGWIRETDHRSIEEQTERSRSREMEHVHPISVAGLGAIEHDACCLYRPLLGSDDDKLLPPSPLPLGVAVLDASVLLFGKLFPRVAHKHRVQLTGHFSECTKQAKAARAEAIRANVFAALLSAVRTLADAKVGFGASGGDDALKAVLGIVMSGLSVSNPPVQCAAGEALGRLAQAVSDLRFTADVAQNCFDKLKTARDAATRTGHALALGCVHLHVGGMGSGQHLRTSVSILLALAQDPSSPAVQAWSLHALSLIADSGGPMFRSYVEPTLSLCLRLLLSSPESHVEVHQCIGRCLNALVTTVGPELQGNTNTVVAARASFLCACAVMQSHPDALVGAEAIACLQQLHLFAPRHVNLSSLVPSLCRCLRSGHLLLRRASVSCLRQLSQREAREVCDHALAFIDGPQTVSSPSFAASTSFLLAHKDRGSLALPAALFALLDAEPSDERMRIDARETLLSQVTAMAEDDMSRWIILCKDVLTIASSSGNDGINDEEGDDDDSLGITEAVGGNSGKSTERNYNSALQPRWSTRVFAARCLRKIVEACDPKGPEPHFDLSLARELAKTSAKGMPIGRGGNYLVLHLSDLVKMAFVAATSDSDPLRLEGLQTIRLVVERFSNVSDPEFDGHLILEQYQAQMGAALRPAFTADTPPHVTGAACEACSAWIASGVVSDLNDVKRVHQLLVSSLPRLRRGGGSLGGGRKLGGDIVYNESASTLEKLAILKAWAQVYIVAMQSVKLSKKKYEEESTDELAEEIAASGLLNPSEEGLLSLVWPELPTLSKNWLAALKDHALLSLPAEFSGQLPHDGGTFYTAETADSSRVPYKDAWPHIVLASALWLSYGGGYDNVHREKSDVDVNGAENLGLGPANAAAASSAEQVNADRFHLVFGVCMESLCSPTSGISPTSSTVMTVLCALKALLSHQFSRTQIINPERGLAVELCRAIHRVCVVNSSVGDGFGNSEVVVTALDVLESTVESAIDDLEKQKLKRVRELLPANHTSPSVSSELDSLGEGGLDGSITSVASVSHAALEACLCALSRQLTQLLPLLTEDKMKTSHNATLQQRSLSTEAGKIVAISLKILARLPDICSPKGALEILSPCLFLITGAFELAGSMSGASEAHAGASVAVEAAIRSLSQLASHSLSDHAVVGLQWRLTTGGMFAKIVDLAKTMEESTASCRRIDVCVALRAVAALAVKSPHDVATHPSIMYPTVNQFRNAFQSNDLKVRLCCASSLRQVFGRDPPLVPFIHTMAPRVVEFLHHHAASADKGHRESADAEVAILMECIGAVEALVSVVEEKHRLQMLALLVPVLVKYLRNDTIQGASAHLHKHCLTRLMQIGPKYPQEFRSLMVQSQELRTRLENAVRAENESGKRRQPDSDESNEDRGVMLPAIQLKTDFSNFASAAATTG